MVITKIDRREKPREKPKGLNMTTPCKYEGKISVMAQGIEDLKESQKEKFEKLFKILEGNGDVGLCTQTELNKASIRRVWWALPCLITIFGIVIGALNYWG